MLDIFWKCFRCFPVLCLRFSINKCFLYSIALYFLVGKQILLCALPFWWIELCLILSVQSVLKEEHTAGLPKTMQTHTHKHFKIVLICLFFFYWWQEIHFCRSSWSIQSPSLTLSAPAVPINSTSQPQAFVIEITALLTLKTLLKNAPSSLKHIQK